MIIIPKLMMVFDVESIGLHGEGFAVGWTIINNFGVEVTSALACCFEERAKGDKEDAEWVAANVPKFYQPMLECSTPKSVRDKFWGQYQHWKEQGAVLFAECLWPVEGRFLNACVDDLPSDRKWKGPYPFHEIASIMLAARMDPMAGYDRMENEMPAHNPLADARQSARLLMEAFSKLNSP